MFSSEAASNMAQIHAIRAVKSGYDLNAASRKRENGLALAAMSPNMSSANKRTRREPSSEAHHPFLERSMHDRTGGIDGAPKASSLGSQLSLSSNPAMLEAVMRQQWGAPGSLSPFGVGAIRGTFPADPSFTLAGPGLTSMTSAPAFTAPPMAGAVYSLSFLGKASAFNSIQMTHAQRRAHLLAASLGQAQQSFQSSLVGPRPMATGSMAWQMTPTTRAAAPCSMVCGPALAEASSQKAPSLPHVLSTPEEDDRKLADAQIFLRKHVEFFEATEDDVGVHTRGRNKPILVGQVGIRCRHCAHIRVNKRQKGSTYYPAVLLGLYQAAQNMNTAHMQTGICQEMPQEVKDEFAKFANAKTTATGSGRPYWASSAKKLGMVDTETDGIRFLPSKVRELYCRSK